MSKRLPRPPDGAVRPRLTRELGLRGTFSNAPCGAARGDGGNGAGTLQLLVGSYFRPDPTGVGLLRRILGRDSEDSPDVRSLNACVVHAGGLLGVVGESYRQDALREVATHTTDASAFSDDVVDYAAEVAAKEPHRRWFMAVLCARARQRA